MVNLNVKSDTWFPDCAFSTNPSWIHDAQYQDFDEQAQRLTGHDQDYLQLSPGAFQGRFLSAFLGDALSVHIERCNQALEQCVTGSPRHFCFGVVLSDQAPFRVNGESLSPHDVLIAGPNAAMHLYSPAGGAVMAVVIERDRLLKNPVLPAAAAASLDQMASGIGVVHAPGFADRLREDAIQAIENGTFFSEQTPAPAGDALLASIASKLALEWQAQNHYARSSSNSFKHFNHCRTVVHNHWNCISKVASLTEITGASKRSLEHAFSTSLATGPLTYVRLLRLHLARRALLSAASARLSIGDVAANHGFWNWSRFTHQYRKQFGELPSDTRLRYRQQ